MIRIVSFAAALASSAVLLSPTAGHAQRPGNYYSATPIAAPARDSLVASNTIWSCDGGVCVAGKAADRDEIVCERVVKNVGKLSEFSANGAALDADTLAKCNARAK